MGESSASYIRMVQHLIEKCLLFYMNKEECMEALSKHANINPVITSTELEKENREFFNAYNHDREQRAQEMETMQSIQKKLAEMAARSDLDSKDD